MTLVDLIILWEWEYDEDFVNILNARCRQLGLNTFVVSPLTVHELWRETERLQLSARFLFDRATDTNPAFEPLAAYLLKTGAVPVNDPAHLNMALDKGAMHHQLIEKGVHVPYTIILSPTRDWTKIKIGELIRLGEPFIIKPALGGGGVGVELNAKTLFDIVKAREAKSKEWFLLQEKVVPVQFGGRRGWFRAFYICGNVILCWWDDITHVYQKVTEEEEKIYALGKLKDDTLKIAELARLNFFSTEFAIVDRERFVAVDYVNDQCDMRLKSMHPDGVPDEVVQLICGQVARHLHASLYAQGSPLRVVHS